MKFVLFSILFSFPFLNVSLEELGSLKTINNKFQNDLPNVFMIGEHENEYEQIISGCDNLLLTVCDESMDDAYKNWLTLLSDMEAYAELVEFDIKGVKIWLNVFWNSDGTIQHMVYYPKPNSRNMDFSLLSKFLNDFVQQYPSSLQYNACFSHYGSGTFPTFASYYLEQQKK